VAGVRLQRAGDLDARLLVDREEPLDVAPSLPEPAPTDAPQPAPDPPPEPVLTGPEAVICAYAWDCGTALRIARCESNFRADAIGNGSYGLFQIQASVHAWKWSDFWERWADPVRNTEYAWEIYQGRGWAAWSCF
jgi:hypothetical protein